MVETSCFPSSGETFSFSFGYWYSRVSTFCGASLVGREFSCHVCMTGVWSKKKFLSVGVFDAFLTDY